MKFFAAILFATIALVVADVSHLNRNYLPPENSYDHVHNQHHHKGPASGNHEHDESAPSALISNSSFQLSASEPVSSSAPASDTSFENSHSDSSFFAPETSATTISSKHTADGFDSHSGLSSASISSYSAPESAATFSSDSYSTPESDSFSSKNGYTAPESSASKNYNKYPSGLDTQYAADGGYVY